MSSAHWIFCPDGDGWPQPRNFPILLGWHAEDGFQRKRIEDYNDFLHHVRKGRALFWRPIEPMDPPKFSETPLPEDVRSYRDACVSRGGFELRGGHAWNLSKRHEREAIGYLLSSSIDHAHFIELFRQRIEPRESGE